MGEAVPCPNCRQWGGMTSSISAHVCGSPENVDLLRGKIIQDFLDGKLNRNGTKPLSWGDQLRDRANRAERLQQYDLATGLRAAAKMIDEIEEEKT